MCDHQMNDMCSHLGQAGEGLASSVQFPEEDAECVPSSRKHKQ